MDKTSTVTSKNPYYKRLSALILLALVVWIILTVVIPIIQGDSLNNYNGVKEEAAASALDTTIRHIDNKSRWAYYFHVDEVRPVTDSEKSQFCQNSPYATNNPNDIGYYTVIISYKNWLAFWGPTDTYVWCNSHKYL